MLGVEAGRVWGVEGKKERNNSGDELASKQSDV